MYFAPKAEIVDLELVSVILASTTTTEETTTLPTACVDPNGNDTEIAW